MKAIEQAARDCSHGKAQGNKHLQADYITIRLSPLNLFYALVYAYWLALIVETLL
jgi:hypothetical protein